MTRISKKQKRRSMSPKRRKLPSVRTGSLKDNLKLGYREHPNAVPQDVAHLIFVPKIK